MKESRITVTAVEPLDTAPLSPVDLLFFVGSFEGSCDCSDSECIGVEQERAASSSSWAFLIAMLLLIFCSRVHCMMQWRTRLIFEVTSSADALL